MWKDFRKFVFRGNVMDMAVGVMIGAAFGAIVTSLVNDLFMPLISLLTGGFDLTQFYIALDGNSYESLAAAREAGASVFAYGSFLSAVINFLLIALCVFIFVRLIGRLKRKPAEEPKAVRLCPYCRGEIAQDATRCPHCTSQLSE